MYTRECLSTKTELPEDRIQVGFYAINVNNRFFLGLVSTVFEVNSLLFWTTNFAMI
jgi:hypothetical protein